MKREIPIVDMLVIVLMLVFLLSIIVGVNQTSSCVVPFIMLGIYFATRLAFISFPRMAPGIILICVISVVCAETLTGYSQLFFKHGFLAYSLKGTFNHSAPFAGFLVTCISILLAASVLSERTNLKKISQYVALFAFIIIPVTLSRAALLALAITCTILFRDTIKKWILVKKRYLIVIPVLLLGVCVYFAKKTSADGRLYMDKISVRAMNSNSVLGAGLGNFEKAFGNEQTLYIENRLFDGNKGLDLNPKYERERMLADCPTVAYNEYLQIGVEAGPIAMVLFIAILVISVIRAIRNKQIWGYGLLSFSIFAFFSYPFYRWEFQILIPVIAALCAPTGLFNARPKAIGITYFLLCVFSVTMVAFSVPDVRQQKQMTKEWEDIRPLYENDHIGIAIGKFETITNIEDYPTACLYAYGHSLNQMGEYEKSDSILKIGAERSSDPMFWNIMGKNSMELGKYDEAEERYMHAFHMIPNRLYPLCLLAKLYEAEGDTARFLNMAEKVESFVPKVESIKTERMRAEIKELKSHF